MCYVVYSAIDLGVTRLFLLRPGMTVMSSSSQSLYAGNSQLNLVEILTHRPVGNLIFVILHSYPNVDPKESLRAMTYNNGGLAEHEQL